MKNLGSILVGSRKKYVTFTDSIIFLDFSRVSLLKLVSCHYDVVWTAFVTKNNRCQKLYS